MAAGRGATNHPDPAGPGVLPAHPGAIRFPLPPLQRRAPEPALVKTGVRELANLAFVGKPPISCYWGSPAWARPTWTWS